MMRWLNSILVIAVLVAGYMSYSLEHQTRQLERHIRATERAIDEERENIKLLKAEWSSLVKPSRLQEIADTNMQLSPVTASQIITEAEIAARVPSEPIIKLEAQDEDAIGSILEKMQ
jgi:cell division protein FtsL